MLLLGSYPELRRDLFADCLACTKASFASTLQAAGSILLTRPLPLRKRRRGLAALPPAALIARPYSRLGITAEASARRAPAAEFIE